VSIEASAETAVCAAVPSGPASASLAAASPSGAPGSTRACKRRHAGSWIAGARQLGDRLQRRVVAHPREHLSSRARRIHVAAVQRVQQRVARIR